VEFLSDYRIRHFYDLHQTVGKAIADSVGWAGKIAWDIYLFYKPFETWTETPPKPIYWMHQLRDDWATKNTYRTGSDLREELYFSMRRLLVQQ
jgi:hypothetical protein